MLQPQFFFLSPVRAIKVTKDNLQEAAEWCGGTVLETPSRRNPAILDGYVLVPTPEGSKISWAFPNMYITQRLVVTGKGEMKTSFAVFKRDYFEKNYFDDPQAAVTATWEMQASEKSNKKRADIDVKVHVADAMTAALEKARVAMQEAGASAEVLAAVSEIFEDASEDNQTQFKHEHSMNESCETNDCITDRYADGVHEFTDMIVDTDKTPFARQELIGIEDLSEEAQKLPAEVQAGMVSNHNGES